MPIAFLIPTSKVDDHPEFRMKYECCFIWVDVALPVLNSFVSERVDRMVAGLVDEVRRMFDSTAEAEYTHGIRKAMGLPEMDEYLWGESNSINDEETQERLLHADIQAFVDLHFIRVYNLSMVKGCEVYGKPGLASPGGSHHKNNLIFSLEKWIHVDAVQPRRALEVSGSALEAHGSPRNGLEVSGFSWQSWEKTPWRRRCKLQRRRNREEEEREGGRRRLRRRRRERGSKKKTTKGEEKADTNYKKRKIFVRVF